MSHITVSRVDFSYNGTRILNDINVSIPEGGILSVLGPNGSGKTTLLKLILGLYTPVKGEVLLDGNPIKSLSARIRARHIAYVPQVHRMTFAFKVLDVVMMGRIPHKPFFFRFGKDDLLLAEEAMNRMGIIHLRDRPYTEISGGERQLCLIARALTQGATTFVMDEPVSGLDYSNQIRLLSIIRNLSKDGYTFIQSTHFPDHALWMAGSVLMLDKGRIVAGGNAEETVTSKALSELYQMPMDVTRTMCGIKVCIPERLRRDS